MSGAPLVRVRGLRKSFEGRTVLDGISLDVHEGVTSSGITRSQINPPAPF